MSPDPENFVALFRDSAPYIRAHSGRTFVIYFDGAAVASEHFAALCADINLLHTLGARLVLVHGARPQIEERLAQRQIESQYHQALRITDPAALGCVLDANGAIRVQIEARLSAGAAAMPMANASGLRVASGNFVIARPLGIRNGVDLQQTGELRRLDVAGINSRLAENNVVLLSPVGYSPSGEVFNLGAEELAMQTAQALGAAKLIMMGEDIPQNGDSGLPLRNFTPKTAQLLLDASDAPPDWHQRLRLGMQAVQAGLSRVHLLDYRRAGALLLELYTRDGMGILINGDAYDRVRPASIDDIGGILQLLEPLEADGVLVQRSREQLELEIEHFTVLDRDGRIIGCAALYPYTEGWGELACVVVHPEYRAGERGDQLLAAIEQKAASTQVDKLFVLTTRTEHWFRERGFEAVDLEKLPMERQQMYNYQRKSKVFRKIVTATR